MRRDEEYVGKQVMAMEVERNREEGQGEDGMTTSRTT